MTPAPDARREVCVLILFFSRATAMHTPNLHLSNNTQASAAAAAANRPRQQLRGTTRRHNAMAQPRKTKNISNLTAATVEKERVEEEANPVCAESTIWRKALLRPPGRRNMRGREEAEWQA